jgi:hypothetical protein
VEQVPIPSKRAMRKPIDLPPWISEECAPCSRPF